MRLPDFVIAGTMKSGTTALFEWLSAHPQVGAPPGKELHFFNADGHWSQGPSWYARWFEDVPATRLTGEATPLYSFYPEALDRMASLIPEARVIMCLRDPVDRAYSHYRHFRDRRASERRSFAQAVEDELAGDVDRPGRVEHGHYGADAERYVAQGQYVSQLEWMCERFPRERLHVVLLDDLRADPVGTYAATCRFLGIDAGVQPPAVGERANVHFEYRPARLWRFLVRHRLLDRMPDRVGRWLAVDVMRREAPASPMDEAVKERLAAHYAPYNAALATWLDRDLPGWTAPSPRYSGV